MEANFWHHKWGKNEIGFHENQPNPLLIKHLAALQLAPSARLFIPLCGKTLDIGWLLTQGYSIAGAELSQLAVDQLFEQLNLVPAIIQDGEHLHYQAKGIDIFVGDILELTPSTLGDIDAVYDRAAIVALPPAMRSAYTQHIEALTNVAPQLVITYEYDQNQADGPPFSVSLNELTQRYSEHYRITVLTTQPVPGGLRGQCEATEKVSLLTPLTNG